MVLYLGEAMTFEHANTFSNPRLSASVEDYPLGSGRRGTANFEIETSKKGQRVSRTTFGKPKTTTYCQKMVLVDGDDGRLYAIGLTEYNQIIVYPGTLQYPKYHHSSDATYGELAKLFS